MSQRQKRSQKAHTLAFPLTEKFRHLSRLMGKRGDTNQREGEQVDVPSTLFVHGATEMDATNSAKQQHRQVHLYPATIYTQICTAPCFSTAEHRALEKRIENAEFAGIFTGPTARDAPVVLRIRELDGRVRSVLCPWYDFRNTEAHSCLISEDELRYIEKKI
ncbi:hypothetical protein N7449_007614 [Penicillium cf. viridicatum]|uniref:Uncharacterized protein n=1 Tax=Penicillium cf. viridicatum TaxID=2972119 RepID=A0A9W9JHN1_9EURO|nr:hypothetical protein N7449_007614 [Penicillium cf. viridicatum]